MTNAVSGLSCTHETLPAKGSTMCRYIVYIDSEPWTWQPSLQAARNAALCRRCHVAPAAHIEIVDAANHRTLWRDGHRVAA
jgi:hypothetical protein